MEALRNVQQLVRSVLVGLTELQPKKKNYINTYSTFIVLYLTNVFIFTGDSRATNAVRAACKDVGSVSDTIFEMRFNPNVFSPGNHEKLHTHTHSQFFSVEHSVTYFSCFVFRSIIPSH